MIVYAFIDSLSQTSILLVMYSGLTYTVVFIRMTKPPEASSSLFSSLVEELHQVITPLTEYQCALAEHRLNYFLELNWKSFNLAIHLIHANTTAVNIPPPCDEYDGYMKRGVYSTRIRVVIWFSVINWVFIFCRINPERGHLPNQWPSLFCKFWKGWQFGFCWE